MQAEKQDRTATDNAAAEAGDDNLNRSLRGKWRKRLFWFWVTGTALVGLYLVIGGPLTAFTGLDRPDVALVVVPFLILLLVSGLAWLILLVRSRR